MKKRKFAEGGSALEDLAEGKTTGRFDSDTYKRALAFRKNVDKEDRGSEPETRKASSAPAPKPKAEAAPSPSGVSSGRGRAAGRGADDDVEISRAPAPSPAPASSRAEIPVDTSAKAPAESDPEGRMGMSDTERNLRNTATALTPFGAGAANRAIGSRLTTSGILGAQAGRQDAAVAQAAARGAASRAGVQARRAQRQAAEAKAMEEAKPILKARPKKTSPRSRTRDEEGIEFAKGGKVRGGGCEQRGKTRGRMY